MSSRSERDKQKPLNEKHQVILSTLLKDEDNKYCVDCDAKGPRWASWNLGIFLCIRCAGIHRNLGVHISKVKSVNLDTWTAEQIAMMQEMGNSRARAVYEANLPDNFRRPQTDSGLEAFIRAKYEQKKYIAQEWVPPKPKVQPIVDDPPKKEKKKNRPRPAGGVQLNNVPAPSKTATSAKAEAKPQASAQPAKVAKAPAASVDLLGLDTPAIPATSSSSANSNDLFGEFIGSGSVNPAQTPAGGVATSQSATTDTNAAPSNGLQDMNLFGDTSAAAAGTQDKQKATKESILALYGSGGGAQMFGVPGGMYMANATPPQQQTQQQQPQTQQQQQQQQQQMWAAASMQQNGAMAANQNAAMGMQGMMGVQGNAMMGNQQPNMMMGQMPATSQGMVPQAGMMPNMYNMPQGMYGMPQQMQQVQNQMGSLNLGTGAIQQPGMVSAGGGNSGANWAAQTSGQTLSNNLWQ